MEDKTSVFSKCPRLLFITVKGNGSYQKIGKINDLIRKVSGTYFIVREQNKQKDGFHYHAIVSQRKDLEPNWFRKGVHINVQNIGDKKIHHPIIPESEEERLMLKYGSTDLDDDDKLIADHQILQQTKLNTRHRNNVKYTHVARVLTYMYKELPVEPKEFEDFIYKRGGSPEAISRTTS